MNAVRYAWSAIFFVIVAAGIGLSINLQIKGNRMSSVNRMAVTFANTRPICVGRFIIDVPIDAEVVMGPARIPVETWRKPNDGGKLEEFVRNALAQSIEDRWRARDELTGRTSLLGKVRDGVGPNHKIVFGVGRSDGSSYNVQSFIRAGNDLFIQEYEAFGEDNDYLKAVDEANEIARHLRFRKEEMPLESGFCIDGAFVTDTDSYMVEAANLGIRLKAFEDVHLSIQTTKKERYIASDAIEPRLKSAENSANERGLGHWYRRIRFLRRGQKRIGNWDGFEVAAHIPRQMGSEETHEFAFLSHGEPKNPMLPVLDVKLHTGVRDNEVGGTHPSITDDEALFLWDKILSSIRPRPIQTTTAK